MPNLSLAGANYPDMTQSCNDGPNVDMLPGVYYALPPFGMPPQEHAPIYQELQVTYPGVDGIGVKRMGFRGRPITCDMVVLAASKSDCETYKNALFAALTPLASFSVQVPEGTLRTNCRLLGGTATGWSTWGGLIALTVRLELMQFRLN